MIERRSTLRWWRWLLSLAAIVWALAIPAAAFAASWSGRPPALDLAIALPYAAGAVICHQQAARSFALWSHQLPVCARCTGIYAGAALVALAATFRRTDVLRHNRKWKVAQDFLTAGALAKAVSPARTILLAAIPTIATLAYEWSTGITPSNTLRAIAGAPLGAAVASAILAVAGDQVN